MFHALEIDFELNVVVLPDALIGASVESGG